MYARRKVLQGTNLIGYISESDALIGYISESDALLLQSTSIASNNNSFFSKISERF